MRASSVPIPALVYAGPPAFSPFRLARLAASLRSALAGLADELCDGRLLLVQEGGYARTYAGYCLHATLEGVLGLDDPLGDPLAYLPDDPGRGRSGITAARTYLSRYWAL